MLLAMLPLSIVHPTVRPLLYSLAVPFIFFECTLIYSTIIPSKLSVAIHIIIFPLTPVFPPIRPLVRALSVHEPLIPIAFIGGPICKYLVASSMLFAIFKLALVFRAVVLCFHTFSMVGEADAAAAAEVAPGPPGAAGAVAFAPPVTSDCHATVGVAVGRPDGKQMPI